MRITTSDVDLLAHCTDPLCEGNQQQEVKGTATHYVRVYGEEEGLVTPTSDNPLGGFEERSWTVFAFADPAAESCPYCGTRRDVTDQERPRYASRLFDTNGKPLDQMALLRLKREGKILAPGEKPAAEAQDDRVAALERELAELRGFINGQRSVEPNGHTEPEPEPPAQPRMNRKATAAAPQP